MEFFLQNNNYQTINKISPTIYNSKIADLFQDNYQNTTIDNTYNNNIANMSNTYHNLIRSISNISTTPKKNLIKNRKTCIITRFYFFFTF